MKKLLVIVDMQNDFVTGCLGTPEAQSIVSSVAAYAESFDGDIVFTRDTHGEDYLSTQEGRRLPVTHCIKGTDGWQIVSALRPLSEKCRIFDKNVFGSRELAAFVSEHGYESTELCGVCTGICVISNAVLIKAFSSETTVAVLSELCACVTPESHRTALEAMKTCQIDVRENEKL